MLVHGDEVLCVLLLFALLLRVLTQNAAAAGYYNNYNVKQPRFYCKV